jgi:SAM-dependent methyltransferase
MAESIIFIFIAGALAVSIIYIFNLTWVDPIFLVIVLTILILPGIYAAITSGPFVPSSRKRHQTMLSLADLKPNDIVYDIGCGDGRLIFKSAPHVKKAIGYELSIPLVLFGKIKSLFASPKAQIRFGDIWVQDYKDADVIFCYLLPGSMKKFYKKIWPTLKPGTRVISNAFQIHELEPVKEEDKVYLYKA